MDNRERALALKALRELSCYADKLYMNLKAAFTWQPSNFSNPSTEKLLGQWEAIARRGYEAESALRGEARAAIEGEGPSESVELLIGALEGIAAGHDCACDHDDDNCCERVEEYCPKCIAEVALEKWKVRAEPVLEAPPRDTASGGILLQKHTCECAEPYEGARLAGTPRCCERCGGLIRAAAPLPAAREGLEALLTRYEALPGDDNLSVEFVRQDLRAVKAGTYNPHRR